jgi:flagellar M-ring protein FliF
MNSLVANVSRQLTAYTRTQKIGLAASGVLVIGLLWAAVHFANRIDYQLLYSELDPAEAQAIVQKLQNANVAYELSEDGRSIKVQADKLSETRIKLASEGLPSSGRIGFEIFDQTTFGLTNFQEQVNYQRALEGELARSIMTLSEVDAVRVHLVLPKESLFQSPEDQAKASVILKLKNGRTLSESAVQGIVNVVASSVKGLTPERITLIDYRGKVLSRPESQGALTAHQQDASHTMESELEAKIIHILEPAVGQGKVRPRVSLRMNFQQVEETTERFDPQASVVRSSQKTEERQMGRSQTAGIPGPRGVEAAQNAAAADPAGANTATAARAVSQQEPSLLKQSESTNFEVSKSVRRMVAPVTAIEQLSVAVLVDNRTRSTTGGDGKVQTSSEPHSPDDMKKYRELVSAAVGFNEKRGDRLIVENISFEGVTEFPAEPTFIERQAPVIITGLRYLVVPFLFILVYLLFLRPIQKTVLASWSNPANAALNRNPAQAPLTVRQLEAQLQPAGGGAMDAGGTKLDLIRARVAEQAQRDPENMARVVRTWISEDKVK